MTDSMESTTAWRSSTRCLLFLMVAMTATILYITFIIMTYDQSVDSAQFVISGDVRKKEQRNTKSRIAFVETDPRFTDREKSMKDWLQQKPRGAIDSKNRESNENIITNSKSDISNVANDAKVKEGANWSQKQNRQDATKDNSKKSNMEGEDGNGAKSAIKGPEVLMDKTNIVTIETAAVPTKTLNQLPAAANSTLEFASNLDFGSGSYKAFWFRSGGPFLLRLSAYNKAIDDLREKLVKARGETPLRPLSESIRSLWCNRDDFHKELENHPSVKTVALAWNVTIEGRHTKWDSKKDTSNLMIQNYYPWTGSNSLCNWINTRGFTRARWDAVYNRECKTLENTTGILEPTSLEPVYLHGKPINKEHYWPNHGSSYPQYFYTTTPPQVLYMHIIEDAVITSLGDVISGNLKLLPYSCSQDLGTSPPPNYENSPIFDEVFIMGQYWGASFFHLMLENMPRVAPYVPFLRTNPNILIHTQSREGHTAKLLEVLTLNRTRLIQGTARAKRVYLPQATPCGFAQIQSTQLLARHYLNHMKPLYDPNQRRSVLLIRRSGSRRFTQHMKIHNQLAVIAGEFNLDFQMFIDNPSPSMHEAMLMFRRAVLVVGPHGAGLSNIIYCEPGTVIIEGVCNPPHVNMCYQWSAHILGHRYHGIASRGGCETWVDVDYQQLADAARSLLKQKLYG